MCEILTRTSEVANLKGECSLCSLKTSQDSVFYRLLAAKENKHILWNLFGTQATNLLLLNL